MGDLKGRDVNGMHAAQWGKLDTSAISKVKVPAKCTNEQLADAVKQMLIESVDKLYGTNKDKKYVKIVDMIMMRVRGALEKLNEQIQEAQKEVVESFDTDELISKLEKSLSKIIEDNQNKQDQDTAKKLQELYDAVNELIENETEKRLEESSKREDSQQSKPEEQKSKSGSSTESIDDFNKIDTSIKEQHESSQSQLQLLEDLQKQITDNFSKIESLITANSMQKNAEVAAGQMSKSVDEKITSIEKSNEKSIRQQISSLNERTGNISEDNKDYKDKKSKDKKKKQKSKVDLKDVMTGKQFDMLKSLLKTQFFEMVDISNEIIKRNNQQFKKINENLEKLIKDRQKNGFSWAKLMLFLSLFFIPFFWGRIKSLLNTADTSIDLDEKIDAAVKFVDNKATEFINNINWDALATKLKDSVWDYLKEKFDEFIKDPMGWMADEVKKTYDDCVAWVKDLWLAVTGKSKEQNEQEKKNIEAAHVKRIDKNIDDFQKNLKGHTDEINGTATAKTNELKTEIEKSNNFIVTSESKTTEKLNKMQNVVEQKATDLEETTSNAIANANSFAALSQQDLQSNVNDALSAGMQSLTNDTKSIIDTINKNGPPSDFDKAMMKSFETAAASVEKEEPDNLTQPDISKLASVKDYVMVKTADQKGNIIAKKSEVSDQLKLLEKNTKSKNVQHIQNYLDFGQYDTTQNIVDNYKNAGDLDQQIERKKALEDYKKLYYKNNGLEQKVSDESTDATLAEQEAKLFSNVDSAFNAVLQNSATIKSGLEDNQKLLDKIREDCSSMFTDIAASLKTIKSSSSTTVNNTSILSINTNDSSSSSITDANMKD